MLAQPATPIFYAQTDTDPPFLPPNGVIDNTEDYQVVQSQSDTDQMGCVAAWPRILQCNRHRSSVNSCVTVAKHSTRPCWHANTTNFNN